MKQRGAGILLHLSSLPCSFGVGDTGPWAKRFVDFLASAKQKIWQILPLNPTDPIHFNSPYHSTSAFACNPLLISPELLIQDGLLSKSDLEPIPEFPADRVDYQAVTAYKVGLLGRVYESFKGVGLDQDYAEFCAQNAFWLDDFALFQALKSHFKGKVWRNWPHEMRDRHRESMASAKKALHEVIHKEKVLQFIFSKQWVSLRDYCDQKGVRVFGDMPIYVDYDSADVWRHPELFKLDEQKRPDAVAGVPPDYFSETGQLWGNPIYRWDVLKERGYDWWIERISHNLRLYDLVRIDHFRGLVAYWEVPATEKHAINGQWIEAPATDLLDHLMGQFPSLPIVAEDLGVITPDVKEVMDRFGLPGMKLLLFAFGDDLPNNPYIPHNLPRNCIAYTGTHDNNTARGWFENEASPEEKERLFQYLGREVPAEELHWELIRLIMMSAADMAIFPMQDILGLGQEARMNRPATVEGNWLWRLLPEQLTPSLAEKVRKMTEIYGRV